MRETLVYTENLAQNEKKLFYPLENWNSNSVAPLPVARVHVSSRPDLPYESSFNPVLARTPLSFFEACLSSA